MNKAFRPVAMIAAGALLSLTVNAQDSFSIVGSGRAQAVSSDGSVVAGTGGSGASIWIGASEIPLGTSGDCPDVSAFGTFACGSADDAVLGGNTAYQYDNGFWLSCGSLGGGGCPEFGSAYAMSDGGEFVVGLAWDGCTARAFKWDANTQVMSALANAGTSSSRANAISGDGEYVGGWDRVNASNNVAALWHPNGTEEFILTSLAGNPDGFGEIWGLSEDGTWSCGKQAFNGEEPFRWSATTGPELLGFLPAIGGASTMEAITGDGSHVIGWQGSAGPFGGVISAVSWTETAGYQTLEDWCNDRGLALPLNSLPAGNPLWFSVDMTDDGSTIAGYSGDFFSGQTAWRIDIDTNWTGLGNGLDGITGQPLLNGAGSLGTGTSGSLTVQNGAPSAASGLFTALGATTPTPFKSGVLVAVPFVSLIGFATDINGGALFAWPSWPAGIPSGTDITFQAAIQDAAAISGVSLTNAILATSP